MLNAQIAAQEDKIKLLENSMAFLTNVNISPSPSTFSSSFTSTLASASPAGFHGPLSQYNRLFNLTTNIMQDSARINSGTYNNRP